MFPLPDETGSDYVLACASYCPYLELIVWTFPKKVEPNQIRRERYEDECVNDRNLRELSHPVFRFRTGIFPLRE
jgi:hypothetical protein